MLMKAVEDQKVKLKKWTADFKKIENNGITNQR